MTTLVWEAIILAGGQARRLGGRDKAQLVGPDGRTCLEGIIQGCAGAAKRVVVGPQRRISSVIWTQEEPAFSGPARAIAAGVTALGQDSGAEWVVVLACDMPYVGQAVAVLLNEAEVLDVCGVEAIVGISEDGRHQWLCAAYRKKALIEACERLPVGGSGESVRFLIGDLILSELPVSSATVEDIDTESDMRMLGFGTEEYRLVKG